MRVHEPVTMRPIGKIFIVIPGRTKGLAVLGVALKMLTRKAASEVESVVNVLRPMTERETMGVMRAWRLDLWSISRGIEWMRGILASSSSGSETPD